MQGPRRSRAKEDKEAIALHYHCSCMPPIHDAAQRDVMVARHPLSNRAVRATPCIDAKDCVNETALSRAASDGHLEVVLANSI